MLTDIFYAYGIIIIVYEILAIFYPKYIEYFRIVGINSTNTASDLSSLIKSSNTHDIPSEDIRMVTENLVLMLGFQCSYAIWNIIGVFTFQPYVFILILIISMISPIFKKTYPITTTRIDGILCFLLVSYAIFNHYIFHLYYSDLVGIVASLVR